MAPSKRLARTAGFLYLGLPVFMGFAAFGVRERLSVSGDAAATSANIAANSGLFRLGLVADLIGITLYLLLAMALYVLLKHVDRNVASAMVVVVAVAAAVLSLNMLNHAAALEIATEGSFGPLGGSEALALMFLELHEHGYRIAQVFFGLWLLPLGYLAYKSSYFPQALGALLMVAAFTHLVEMLAHFLAPGLAAGVVLLIQAPAIIAEFWMIGYLLIKGVRMQAPAQRSSVLLQC